MADSLRIKAEPEAGSSSFAEDELDESTDLDFYDNTMPGDPYSTMYLARLPGYLWKAWSELGDDEEIEIGKIRQWADPDGTMRLQMLLRPDLKPHEELPKEYDMQIADPDVSNTFIFSEQDLPSYVAKNKERAAALARGIPAHVWRQQQQKQGGGQQTDRVKKGTPYTRRGVPKKTAIAGRIKHEVNCTPVLNAETDYYLTKRTIDANKPKGTVRIMDRLPPNGVQDAREWDKWIKTTEKASKAKKMDMKHARWPENRLLDAIAECFSTHNYWPIKALRERIPQPEAFIREGLDKIAVLNRTGRFANCWSLKPAYRTMIAKDNQALPANDTVAPQPSANIPSDDEDEEDLKMEDVL